MENFDCGCSGSKVTGRLFEISRERARVIYSSPAGVDEADISGSDGLACFCSKTCLDILLPKVMMQQQVSIPKTHPGIEPIERCAKCGGVVDMSDWHAAFVTSESELLGSEIQPIHVEYIALLCRTCDSAAR